MPVVRKPSARKIGTSINKRGSLKNTGESLDMEDFSHLSIACGPGKAASTQKLVSGNTDCIECALRNSCEQQAFYPNEPVVPLPSETSSQQQCSANDGIPRRDGALLTKQNPRIKRRPKELNLHWSAYDMRPKESSKVDDKAPDETADGRDVAPDETGGSH